MKKVLRLRPSTIVARLKIRIDNGSDCMYWLADQHLIFSLLWRNWPEHLNCSGALQSNPPRPYRQNKHILYS